MTLKELIDSLIPLLDNSEDKDKEVFIYTKYDECSVEIEKVEVIEDGIYLVAVD